MSVSYQSHSIIFDRVISAPGHVKYLFDGLNAVDKRYMYQLISTVKLPVSKTSYSKILMHSCKAIKDFSLAK